MKEQLHHIPGEEKMTTVRPQHSHSDLAGAIPARRKKQCTPTSVHPHAPRFKGYTLEELRIKKVVNELQIAAAKDRIMLMVSPQVKGEVKTISGCIRGFDTILKYLDIAMLAYGITRRVTGFFRRFSRHR